MSKRAMLLIVLAVATILVAQAQQPAGAVRIAAEMEPMLAKIAVYEYGQGRVPLSEFSQFVQDSMASPALLKEIEARLLRLVQSDATAAGKDFAFRELSLIGTEASVPVLAGMLDTSDMARYALTRIPGPGVDHALRKALDKSSGNVKIGIINSLGQRRNSKSVSVLRPLLSSSDSGLAEAAAAALADIADGPALDALGAARGRAAGPWRQRFSEAYLRCADRVAAQGNKGLAIQVYKQLTAPAEAEMVRIAALTGLAAADSNSAAPVLTTEVVSKSPRVQRAAIRLLAEIPGTGVTAALVEQFPKLPPSGQVQLLAALADRGDASIRPLLVKAAKENAADVRAAALAGLGRLGDESSVPLLAEAAATSQGAEQVAARESLYGLRGSGIDPAIIAAIGSATGKVRIELIIAAGERASAAAGHALIHAVQDKDPGLRREALKAMRNVAGPAQVPALLELLLQAPGASDRRDAAQTLAAALRRSGPAQAGAVVAAYQAAPAEHFRVSLLEVMGQTSSGEALPLLRHCLKDAAPEIVRAAILALSNWADPAPLADLAAVAKSSTNPAQQILALRGYLKLMVIPSQRPNPESARLLGEAMQLAKEPAEKQTVLSLLPTYPCKESLELAEASLGDAAVANEAKAAVDRVISLLKAR